MSIQKIVSALCLFAFLAICGVSAENATAAGAPGTGAPAYGYISVASYPDGAAVYLNGVYEGTSTLNMTNLVPGTYLVLVNASGYKDFTYNATIGEGSGREIMVNLEPAGGWNISGTIAAPTATATTVNPILLVNAGSLAVDSTPGGATVYLDDTAAGTTPASGRALVLGNVSGGNHTVRVELAGYSPYTATATVLKNQVTMVNAALVAAPGSAAIPAATATRSPLSPLLPAAALGIAGIAAASLRVRRS